MLFSKKAVLVHVPSSNIREFSCGSMFSSTLGKICHFPFNHSSRCVTIPISWKQKPRLTHAEPFAPDRTAADASTETGSVRFWNCVAAQSSRHRAWTAWEWKRYLNKCFLNMTWMVENWNAHQWQRWAQLVLLPAGTGPWVHASHPRESPGSLGTPLVPATPLRAHPRELARRDCSFASWQDAVCILQPQALSESPSQGLCYPQRHWLFLSGKHPILRPGD